MEHKQIIDQTEQYYLPVFGRYPLALTHGNMTPTAKATLIFLPASPLIRSVTRIRRW